MSVIEKNYELEAYFQDAGKPRDKWRVGTEYEKVGIYRDTGQAIPYFGKRGVAFILRELIERFGWDAEEQDGNIIALSRDKAQITLEPGGQIELSGEPCDSIHCTYAEFNQHIRELLEVAEPLGIIFLGLGMQPVSRLDEIEWVPKKRYRIMRDIYHWCALRKSARIEWRYPFLSIQPSLGREKISLRTRAIFSATANCSRQRRSILFFILRWLRCIQTAPRPSSKSRSSVCRSAAPRDRGIFAASPQRWRSCST